MEAEVKAAEEFAEGTVSLSAENGVKPHFKNGGQIPLSTENEMKQDCKNKDAILCLENGAKQDFKNENGSPNGPTEEESSIHRPPSSSSTRPIDDVLKEESTLNDDGAGPSKATRNHIDLSAEVKKGLAEWYGEHELLYNKKLNSSGHKQQKASLYREKASQLNLSVDQLRGWCENARTIFARLCESGKGLLELSEKERWIRAHFAFLEPHIVKCRHPKSKKSFPPCSRMQDVDALPNEKKGALGDLATERLSSPISSAPAVEPPLAKRLRVDPIVDVELIEKTLAAQQNCVELNTRLLSLFQPHSQHTLSVKQFHSFLATLVEQMAPETFEVYTRDAMALVSHYLSNPVPPRSSGFHWLPPPCPSFSGPSSHMAPLPLNRHRQFHGQLKWKKKRVGKNKKKLIQQEVSTGNHNLINEKVEDKITLPPPSPK